MKKSFKKFVALKEENEQGKENKDWRKEHIQLEKGFVPPAKMRPVIDAFLKSGDITVHDDLSKEIKMPKKSLFLVGGPVRDFIRGKSIKDFDLATNATPQQIAHILHNAGFKMAKGRTGSDLHNWQAADTAKYGWQDHPGQRSDAEAKEFGAKGYLPFNPIPAEKGDNKTWFIKGRDNSPERKPHVISAIVDGEEFEIATFRRDAKVELGKAAVDFVDNPNEDAARRDLTMNALYIELSKPDGENNKLYDPTKKGWHDTRHGVTRTVGKAEDRFREDPIRVLRAIRFHSRSDKPSMTMDDDIEKAIPLFRHLKGVALERVRDEFLKGLLHPDTKLKQYLHILKRTGLLEKVFPGVELNANIPPQLSADRDQPLALAWLLQDNPSDKVEAVLSPARGEHQLSGWSKREKDAVMFLLALKEFGADEIDNFMQKRKMSGLTSKQIRNWVDMFNITDDQNKVKSQRPGWSRMVKTFADFQDDPTKKITWMQKKQCPSCKDGMDSECKECLGKGRVSAGIHPEIKSRSLQDVSPEHRSGIVKQLDKERLIKQFKNQLPKN